MNYKL